MVNGIGFNNVASYNNNAKTFAPVKNNDTRKIVKEEIERQKKLDKLEEKYKAGEISNFEYKLGKAMLNLPVSSPDIKVYSATTA